MNNKKWGYLIHLSTNMWNDRPPESYRSDYLKIRGLSPGCCAMTCAGGR